MSFNSLETSRTLGEPVALFLFTYGPNLGDVYGYTSAEQPIAFDNGTGSGIVTYAPVPINRDTIVASGTLDKSALKIRLSKSLDIGQLFTGFPPSQIVTLQIYQGHASEISDFGPLWFGRLLSHEIDDDDIIFNCEPISSALRRSGLRRNYQRTCPHSLYGPQCTVSMAAHTSTAVTQSVNNPSITLLAGWNGSIATNKFLNGPIWWTNAAGRVEYRSILQITSPTILLLDGPCPTLTEGLTVSFAPGCDHQLDDCTFIFSNPNNYGGQPWIPLKNPFGIVSNFV